MRILFIDPPAPLKPKKNRSGMNLNQGIATLTPELLRNGHQVSLYDMVNHYSNLNIDGVYKSLKVFQPNAICIPMLNAQYVEALKIINRIKKETAAPIIVGGAEATAIQEQVFKDSQHNIDYLVIGEAEESLIRLLDCIQWDRISEVQNIKGLIYNENGTLIKTGKTQLVEDLDSFPYPDYEIFGIKRLKVHKVLGSRGCPFNCSFCFSYLGRTWRGRDPKNIVEEIQLARDRYQIESFRFVDANLNYKPEWTHALCDAIINSDVHGVPWQGGGLRADKLSDELCRHMVEAGCKTIAIGVESLHPVPFKMINKAETIDQIKNGVRTAIKYFDNVKAFLIIGLPGDTLSYTYRSYKEARVLGPRDVLKLSYSIAVPYTGTKMEHWVNNHARVFGDSHGRYTRNEFVIEHGVAFETDDFKAEERIKAFRKLNTKEFRYAAKSKRHRMVTPLLWFREALLNDPFNLHSHLSHIVKLSVQDMRAEYFGHGKNTLARPNIEYMRIPDGTWWLG